MPSIDFAAALAVVLALFVTGCSSGSSPPVSNGEVRVVENDAGVTGTVNVGDSANPVTAIAISPLDLEPRFSPDIENYVVRCPSGKNDVTVTTTDSSGSLDFAVTMVEDHAVVVAGKYWIRCLPHDFPIISSKPHPEVGVATPGWFLIGNTVIASTYAGFAIVLDTNGTPVWYQRAGTVLDIESFATNTLSFMPAGTAPFGSSPTILFDVLSLDSGTSLSLGANSGTPTDGHDLRMLSNGHHLVLSYPIETGVDLTGLSTFGTKIALGNNNTMADCQVQEVDGLGNLVWSWLASQHIDPVKESLEPTPYTVNGVSVIDVFHCNSIDVDSSGNLLVSSRHMNSVFYIDRSTGTIQWKLGGTSYNKDGATYVSVVGDDEGTFQMQHDARFQANGHISMFDDHGAVSGDGVARGIEYAVDHVANTATVAWQYKGLKQSAYMGSFRRYADGDSVIGWGGSAPDTRALSEITQSGANVLDVYFGTGNSSYRSVKLPVSQLDIDVMRTSVGLLAGD
jgi:hypothetical protein